eukprot:359853-Chlamydomonas_euryale.AAC.15
MCNALGPSLVFRAWPLPVGMLRCENLPAHPCKLSKLVQLHTRQFSRAVSTTAAMPGLMMAQ